MRGIRTRIIGLVRRWLILRVRMLGVCTCACAYLTSVALRIVSVTEFLVTLSGREARTRLYRDDRFAFDLRIVWNNRPDHLTKHSVTETILASKTRVWNPGIIIQIAWQKILFVPVIIVHSQILIEKSSCPTGVAPLGYFGQLVPKTVTLTIISYPKSKCTYTSTLNSIYIQLINNACTIL